jgi:hypothetical protein
MTIEEWLWIVWIIAFFAIEIPGIVKDIRSEGHRHDRYTFSVVVFLGLAWLMEHFLLGIF